MTPTFVEILQCGGACHRANQGERGQGEIKLFKSEFYSSAGLYKWMFCFRVCRHKNPREEDPRDAGKVSEKGWITHLHPVNYYFSYFRCGISTGKCEKECASVTVLEHTECGCDCGESRNRYNIIILIFNSSQ